jgi:hypothetical protein
MRISKNLERDSMVLFINSGGVSMKVGDLVTHRPTEAVGIIVEVSETSVCVVWNYDPLHKDEGEEEWISKFFIENLKSDK